MNIYNTDDMYGSVIVDAPLSYTHGELYCNFGFNKQTNLTSSFTTLFVNILSTILDLIWYLSVM